MFEQICQLEEVEIHLNEAYLVTEFLLQRYFDYVNLDKAQMAKIFKQTADIIGLVHDIIERQKESVKNTMNALFQYDSFPPEATEDVPA